MPYNSVVSRTDVAGIIPVEYSNQFINAIAEESFVLRMGRRLRDMTVYEETMPVLSALATAFITEGDTDLVQTTEVNWKDVVVTAKSVTAIVPIPKTVLADPSIPLWDQVRPELVTACGVAIDNAQLYGTNKPSAWPTAIVTAAGTASHNVSLAACTDMYEAILGDGKLFSLVEQDGFAVNGGLAHLSMKGKLRDTRDSNGVPIFNTDPSAPGRYILDGAQLYFPTNGVGSSTYWLIAGDWQQLAYSMRQDMEFSVHTEGVIQDAGGKIGRAHV